MALRARSVTSFAFVFSTALAPLMLGACRGCEQPDVGPGDAASGSRAPTVVVEAAADARTASPSGTSATSATPATPATSAPVAVAVVGADAGAKRAPAPGCSKPPGPAVFRARIKRPEGERSYEARLPANVDPQKPARVVILLHPFGSNAVDFLNATHFTDVFLPAGWAIVSPEGTHKSFNGGDCCGEAARSKLDDVGLMLAIADDLRERACIDDERLYLTGFSNGGFMSQAFACAHPERVGAIASVGAVLGVRTCTPSEPVSLLLVNGIGDDVIPIDGGGPFRTRPLTETVATWRAAGGCEERFGDGGVSRSPVGVRCRIAPCREGRTMESCIVPYAHAWMVKSHPAGDPPSQRQTAREIMDFFDSYGVRP